MKQYVGKEYTIYKHTNKLNGKSYIGQTRREDLTRRWTGGNGYRGCPYFYRAIKKYGWNGFTHEILETGLTKEEADKKEIYYILFYQTANERYGYNIKHGGHHDGTLTKETREFFRERYSGENSPVAKSVDVYDLKGKLIQTFTTLSEASKFVGCTCGSLSSACTKRTGTLRGYICHFHSTTNGMKQLPEEMIYKVNEQRSHVVPVAQYSLEGCLIKVFGSREEAAASTGTIPTEISECINRNDRNYANGYIWTKGDNPPLKIEGLSKDKIAKIRSGNTTWSKPVIRKDIKTNEIKEFDTQKDAALEHNVAIITISRWVKTDKPMHGYIWEYKYA